MDGATWLCVGAAFRRIGEALKIHQLLIQVPANHAADEKRRTASESRRAKDSENNDSINRGSGRCAQRLDDADANAQNSAEKTDADKDESEETHRNASLFEYLVQNHYFGHAAPVMFGAPSASVHTG